ncbi:hypothetical protein [Spirosoma fluviale]|uniref:Uncharacterized protein n=1 Tax=Spirosoma fluviale TaxID=1597977 RepID=A0A286FCN6_9BACT|nr:hypothetical protein [Spirosoma fluviale]SOD81001.1 hypothetical protein SAMN06269250_1641 [Spirosoma fluviale]
MRAQELYRTYQTLADTAAQAHLKPARFARLYWVCAIDWLLQLTREPKSERVNRAMQPFKRSYTGAGKLILYKNISPPCLAIRAVRADFPHERTDMPVSPIDSDELGTAQQDPFRRATDDEPKYTEENDVYLEILADSVPLSVRVVYLTFPRELDMTANNEPMETEVDQLAILRRVIAEKDLIDERYNRYQLLASRVIPTAEQPT